MKKILLIAAAMFTTIQSFAQETKFGLTAGYLNINVTSSAGIYEDSVNGSGFFAGIHTDLPLSKAFYLQPSVIYGNADDSNILSIPVLAKYYIANSGFNLLAGPQATLILDQRPGNIKAVGIDFGFGGGYDINEHFFLQAKYFRELTNRADKYVMGIPEDVEFEGSINTLYVGVGYKF